MESREPFARKRNQSTKPSSKVGQIIKKGKPQSKRNKPTKKKLQRSGQKQQRLAQKPHTKKTTRGQKKNKRK